MSVTENAETLMTFAHRVRTVRVVAEASGQRAVIESVDANARPFRSVVNWANLAALNDQLF